jgi:tRNA dimethylallyltransferase
VQPKRPVLIAGPTASGKSALALHLAEHVNGVVINADSMQVYRELRILTARPTPQEEGRAPHALYGFVPAATAFSVQAYLEHATRALAQSQAAGRRAIFVGGTGLYFKALLEGLSPVPEIDPDIRDYWRQWAADPVTRPDLHRRLAELDPEMAARLAQEDTQRLVRALEVIESTGRSLAEWQKQPGTPVIDAQRALPLVVDLDRETLAVRAGLRFDRMLAAGALAEVRALHALRLSPDLPAMRALGVAPLVRALAGECGLDAAIADAKSATRHYIKRQQTWLKRNMIAWKSLSKKQIEQIMAGDFSLIDL